MENNKREVNRNAKQFSNFPNFQSCHSIYHQAKKCLKNFDAAVQPLLCKLHLTNKTAENQTHWLIQSRN